MNVCLPLAPGNQTATELWELVNVAGEAHNFHMHQTKIHRAAEWRAIGRRWGADG